MRDAGIVEGLRERGMEVVDLGDVPRFRWRPDRERPRAMHVAAVASAIEAIAEKVARAAAADHVPLVLGGDCTIELGTVLGMRQHLPSLRLVYLDAHPDLNTPESVADGALDWMGVAHMLGEEDCAPELRDFGPRTPLLGDDQIAFLAHRRDQSTARELETIERRRLQTVPLSAVAADPAAAAGEALASLSTCDRLAVHFDVDCIDFTDAPLSENTGRNVGLTQDAAFAALAAVLLDSRVAALTVTELNPDHGAEDGSTLAAFADRLVAALGGAPVLCHERAG
jgi:arginase